MGIREQVKTLSSLVRQGRFDVVHDLVQQRLHSTSVALGLRRDLRQPFPAPAAKVPITVRRLAHDEWSLFRSTQHDGVSPQGVRERMSRLRILEQGLGTCYAAVTPDNQVAYVQWLFFPHENKAIRSHWQGAFPYLEPGYALLEGAFTFEAFRGLGIMPAAMAQIAEKAASDGAQYVITFVALDNIPSLKGCKRANFWPYCERTEQHWMFRVHTQFIALPAGTPYSFDRDAESA